MPVSSRPVARDYASAARRTSSGISSNPLAREWRTSDHPVAARPRGSPAYGALSPSVGEASAGCRESWTRSRSRTTLRAADALEAQAVTRPPLRWPTSCANTAIASSTPRGSPGSIGASFGRSPSAAPRRSWHRDRRDQCAHLALLHSSSRDRHCPKYRPPRARGSRPASRNSCPSGMSTSSSRCPSHWRGWRSSTNAWRTTSSFRRPRRMQAGRRESSAAGTSAA